MKDTIYIYILTTSVILFLAGCSFLSPGKKEFFQSKVPQFPESPKLEESTKQGLTFVKYKVDEAYTEGLKAEITNSVMTPLAEAKLVIPPLISSIGHPKSEYTGDATNLVNKLNQQLAAYEKELNKLKDKLQGFEGKKIEGTGWIQVSYWTYITGLLILGFIIYIAIKILSMIYPPVTVGTSVVKMGSNLLAKGFSSVVQAGENFKNDLDKKIQDPKTAEYIKELFRDHQMKAQDLDIQNTIRTLTK